MNGRAFIQACAVGALALGATAALSGCDPNKASTASGGATQSTTTQAATTTASTQTAATTSGSATASAANATAVGTATGDGGSAQNAGAGGNACATGQVSVKLTDSDAAAGHRAIVLLFTNTGSSACTLTGYPGATVTDNGSYNFAPLVNAKRTLRGYEGGANAVGTVSLSPGGSASAVLEWVGFPTDGEAASAANCPGMAGGYLEITPPNTTVSTRYDPPGDMCADIEIHPVVTGSSGRSAG